MTPRKTFTLRNLQQGHEVLRRAWDHCKPWLAAGHTLVLQVLPEPKSRAMENRYHQMIDEIAKVWTTPNGRRLDRESMKRILLDQFQADTIRDPEYAEAWRDFGEIEMIPSMDGKRIVMLGIQSRNFGKVLGGGFIDWLDAVGADLGIVWEKSLAPDVEAVA